LPKKEVSVLEERNEPIGLYHFFAENAPLQEVIKKTYLPTLDIIPETHDLVILDKWINQQQKREFIYQHRLIPLLKQYEVIVSIIAQRVSEYRKKVVQSAKEYAPLSTAKYAAKYAGSSALYSLLKDSRQVNFDTDILDIYGLSAENYMNTRDKQANIPGSDAVGASGGLQSDKLQTTHKRHSYTTKKKPVGDGAAAAGTGAAGAGSIFPPLSFSNTEILYRLICIDNARLYMNTLSIINEDLN
jgi:hypothetical protein